MIMAATLSQHNMPSTDAGDNGEEDDYMSMTITEPSKPKHEKETYTQRRIRKEREVSTPKSQHSETSILTIALYRPNFAVIQNPKRSAKQTKLPRAMPPSQPRFPPPTKASR